MFDRCAPFPAEPGGSVLVERAGPMWAYRRYVGGFTPEHCLLFAHPDGHQLLVCRERDGYQNVWHDQIWAVDFGGTPRHHSQTVLDVFSDAVAACLDRSTQREVKAGAITGFPTENIDNDATPELIVEVQWGRSSNSGVFEAKCAALIAEMRAEDGGELTADVRTLIAQKPYRLRFDFDGWTFVPDRKTEALIPQMGDPNDQTSEHGAPFQRRRAANPGDILAGPSELVEHGLCGSPARDRSS